MLYLYPSNKLEHLATLMHGVMRLNAHPPMQKRVLLVQHTGMQHWLSMQIAKESGIAMQLDFPLPTRFVWETCRSILGDETVPQQSPYKREVMVWRILDILRADDFAQSPYADELNSFWSKGEVHEQALQQFRFAQQLADLFEQYLVFRPDWITAWDANRDIELNSGDEFSAQCYQWQKWFWRCLVSRIPMHPVLLQQKAMSLLESKQEVLPDHIYLFAVNTMPSPYIAFFEALSKYVHVHWFHLNPCVDFWADAKSDKAIARQMRLAPLQAWIEQDTHPLLRNFGKQGRDLLVQLMDSSHMEIAAFDPPKLKYQNTAGLLQQLQSDILLGASNPSDVEASAVDENNEQTSNKYSFNTASNIHVHACYSEIRELQALKDFLLLQLKHNEDLGLDDILVMCPAIEDYSPFIKGVFESKDELHLPMSISDRKPLESQASIVAFTQLLSMQDSRFSAQQILSLLSTPAIMHKFSLSENEVNICSQWIDTVRVSFALDTTHKASLLSSGGVSDKYTWEWGIERLLTATFISDEQQIANSVAIAHGIDGQFSTTVGKLIAFLSALKGLVSDLEQPRHIERWADYFKIMIGVFFAPKEQDEFAFSLINQAINGLSEHATLADFGQIIPINNVKQALDQTFSIPESKSRFMCGKITFCSMMPMRSIPFKVVAILGLNQSDFPRSSYPSELDLIGKAAPRIGDRSRRDDDRYLFLEALISVREAFYLSYQYRDIRTNAQREPSLVLKELIEHCHTVYSRQCIEVVEHPLHPFSDKNYAGPAQRSFSKAWLRHAQALQDFNLASSHGSLSDAKAKSASFELAQTQAFTDISVNALVVFFHHPLAYFSTQCLQLRFDQVEVSDHTQPFDVEGLQNYQLRQALYQHFRQQNEIDEKSNAHSDKILRTLLLSGDFPELPNNLAFFEEQKSDIQALVEFMHTDCDAQTVELELSEADLAEHPLVNQLSLQSAIKSLSLKASCELDADKGMLFPIFKDKTNFKDEMRAWIHYLMLVIAGAKHSKLGEQAQHDQKAISCTILSVKHSYGKPKVNQHTLAVLNAEQAQAYLLKLLYWYQKGIQAPLFVNRDMVEKLQAFASPSDAILDQEFHRKWRTQADNTGGHTAHDALSIDPYFHYFYDDVPVLNEAVLNIYFDVYLPMTRQLEESDEGHSGLMQMREYPTDDASKQINRKLS